MGEFPEDFEYFSKAMQEGDAFAIVAAIKSLLQEASLPAAVKGKILASLTAELVRYTESHG